MMHIVLLVLKGAGILLLFLAALLLAFLLAVLFVPVRYRVQAVYGEAEKNARVRFFWLLRLLTLEAVYAGEGLQIRLRLFGVRLGGRKAGDRNAPGKKKRRRKQGRRGTKGRKKAEPAEGRKAEKADKEEAALLGGLGTQSAGAGETEPGQEPEAKEGKAAGAHRHGEGGQNQRVQAREQSPDPDVKAGRSGLIERIKGLFGRLGAFADKIRFSFRRICDKLRDIRELASQAAQWLGDEGNKAALRFLAGQAKKLVLHVLPRKGGGRIAFGFEDPYTTGQVLAAAAPFYPLYSRSIQLCPVFDRKVLRGELDVKGRLRLFTFLWLLFQVYRNKDAWRLIGGLLKR